MDEYNFLGDLLNKYSQLTPWVQVIIGLAFGAVVLGITYFIKEIVALIMKPFSRNADDKKKEPKKEEKKEWRDKYYRDDEDH